MTIVLDNPPQRNVPKKSRRWEHPLRDKLEDVFQVNKKSGFTRPGIIRERKDGSKTVPASLYNYNGKKLVENYLSEAETLALRSHRYIKLIALDIDKGSIYRYDYSSILEAMEEIGLCRVLRVRSSHSGGLHLFFPLYKDKLSEYLHTSIKAWLQYKGFTIADGTLEIFPGARDTTWKGKEIDNLARCFRLPLQKGTGSYLIDEDENVIHKSIERFWLEDFDWAANGQDWDAFNQFIVDYYITDGWKRGSAAQPQEETVAEEPKVKGSGRGGHNGRVNQENKILKQQLQELGANPKTYIKTLKQLVNRGWVAESQSNFLIGAVAILCAYKYRDYNEEELAHAIRVDAMGLSGYQEYASPQSKKDLEDRGRRSWSRRWAKCVIKYREQLFKDGKLNKK